MATMLSVANQPSLCVNLVAHDLYWRNAGIPYFSGFGYASHMDAICKELNYKGKEIAFCRRYYSTGEGKEYETITSRVPGSDYMHIIAYKKDRIVKNERNGEETMYGYVFWESDEQIKCDQFKETMEENNLKESLPKELIDNFYDKLYKLSPLPVIKDWMYYLIEKLYVYGLFHPIEVFKTDDKICFNAFYFSCKVSSLREFITDGLSSGEIQVSSKNNNVSDTMKNIQGLDAYLNEFKDVLAHRIQDSFIPRFIPNEDEYSQTLKDLADYSSYMGRLDLYDAQKGVIQATSNALDHKKTAFIIGEAGSGKTATAISAAMTHNRDSKVLTNIVMCPGHLVEKWKKEIERISPNSDAIIVSNFDELTNLMSVIKDKNRRRHLWLVLSKETAKFGYQECPAGVWSISRKHKSDGVYCCPECGKPLYTSTHEGRGRYRYEVKKYFGIDSFSSKKVENSVCMNSKRVWNTETHAYEEVPCGAKLWQAVGKGDKNWVNLGAKVGWIEKDKIQKEFDRITDLNQPSKDDALKLPALAAAVEGEIPPQKAPIKYPLGRYIRKYLNGYIDYALIDEAHELKAKDSLQGQAFADLVKVARHAICFTGTLLNGYASGIFYILYRTFPGLMKQEGFDFSNAGEQEFARQYGVYRTAAWYEFRNGRQGNTQGTTKTKQLPGVSPIVFTKFLLENAAFISLEDIGAGLPGYEEIPVPVEMDPELNGEYSRLENAIHGSFVRRGGGMKTIGQMIQMLSIYPDQPFDQPPVIHPDSGDIIISPANLNKDRLRNKEREFVRLVKEKVAEGQKVLVYYHWTNRTDLGKKLPKLLKDEGINAVTMSSNVNNRDRERWIQDQVANKKIDVLICNPSLVETGLDLLDFTTIIYYQVGYNLFTLRQSSRRSWRLSQTKDVQVYFLYYRRTVQEQALSLMATKLQAAMAIEGKFSEEGLNAMSNNEDILTQIAASVADGIKDIVDAQVFSKGKKKNTQIQQEEKTRLIDIPKEVAVKSVLEKLSEARAKSRKRILPLRACGMSEKEVMNNVANLFEAI